MSSFDMVTKCNKTNPTEY